MMKNGTEAKEMQHRSSFQLIEEATNKKRHVLEPFTPGYVELVGKEMNMKHNELSTVSREMNVRCLVIVSASVL
jgi:hypothetical protein